MGYNQQSFADNVGLSSFVQPLLAPKSTKSREILREFEVIASEAQGHAMSSILVSIESAYATSY